VISDLAYARVFYIEKVFGWYMSKRPVAVWVLIVAEFLFGLLSLGSGLSLMTDPSGAGIGLPSASGLGLPLGDYLLVGLFLFVIFGIGSLAMTYGLITKKKLAIARDFERGLNFHWSWLGSVVLIGALAAFLAVEIYYIGLQWGVQYATIAIGVVIILLLILPSVRGYYATFQ
jgi:hypothetical protein